MTLTRSGKIVETQAPRKDLTIESAKTGQSSISTERPNSTAAVADDASAPGLQTHSSQQRTDPDSPSGLDCASDPDPEYLAEEVLNAETVQRSTEGKSKPDVVVEVC